MKRIGHYSPEVRERAVWLVQEQEQAHSSQWAASTSISESDRLNLAATSTRPSEHPHSPTRPTFAPGPLALPYLPRFPRS